MADGKWRKGSTAGIGPNLAARLEAAAVALRTGRLDTASLDTLLAELDRLPPDLAQQVARFISLTFRYRLPSEPVPTLLGRLLAFRKAAPPPPIDATPPGHSAWLRLCHPDGFTREVALQTLDDAPVSAFRLALLLVRCDDWVPQVAQAARAAIARLAPGVPLAALQGIAPLIANHYLKRRGRVDLATPVLDLLVREETWPALLSWLTSSTNDATPAFLRLMLLKAQVHEALPRLAAARHYLVRAIAFRALLSSQVEAIAGRTMREEVSYSGRRRLSVPKVLVVPLVIDHDREETIRLAAQDRTRTVRKLAADAMIAQRDELADLDGLLALFENEPSAAIRERLDFIRRRRRPS